jgi:hypothetical protein
MKIARKEKIFKNFSINTLLSICGSRQWRRLVFIFIRAKYKNLLIPPSKKSKIMTGYMIE